MKNTLIIVLVLLLASVGLNVWQWRGARDQEANTLAQNEQLNQAVAAKRAEIRTADSLISFIKEKRLGDSLRAAAQIIGLKESVSVLRQKLSKLPQVIPDRPDSLLLDSIRVAFYTKDTVISQQDSLIVTLDGQISDQAVSFNAELEQEREKSHQLEGISEDFKEVAENAEKQTRREKRKTKFWKIASAVITLGAIFLIAK